jgi:serine/threonine protein phosphatase PrpC
VSEATELRCATCGASMRAEDRFCEQCGARLAEPDAPSPGCDVCGAGADAIAEDGYCSVCGGRARRAADRLEVDLGVAAGVSDRGRVHRRNEDAFHVEALAADRVAAVVCDGISSASAGDAAARRAAEAAGAALSRALCNGDADLRNAAAAAVSAAGEAVELVPWTARTARGYPSCTLVGAARRGDDLVIASVGDSRAYWVADGTARQLTVDDSWAQEQVEDGRLTRQEAQRDRRSHSITHWIGADAPDRPPRVTAVRVASPGRLVLCSDGLWNYLADESELAELVGVLPAGASAAAVARALTDVALGRGGRDNITVAVIDIA